MSTSLTVHETSVLEEAEAWNRKAIAESTSPVCACGGIYYQTLHRSGEDHDYDELRCGRCGKGYGVTTYRSRREPDITEL